MLKALFLGVLIFTQAVHADCITDFISCSSPAMFQNSYKLETSKCTSEAGETTTTTTFKIFNSLVNDCGPVSHEDCMKPIFEIELNYTRHHYFQADLKMVGAYVFLKIDDRRVIHQGDFQLTTPNADYMILDDYVCSMNGK